MYIIISEANEDEEEGDNEEQEEDKGGDDGAAEVITKCLSIMGDDTCILLSMLYMLYHP